MRKKKRYELDNLYYGKAKFDRCFLKDFEGNHVSMHYVRYRRNYRSNLVWLHFKYTEGLLKKYLNKPVEKLKECYYRKVKHLENCLSFERNFRYLLYSDYSKYTIIDGIISKNPNYRTYKRIDLTDEQVKYNYTHIINPGKVREVPIDDLSRYGTGLINNKPIYLGKLFCKVNKRIIFADVYHFYPHFLSSCHVNKKKLAVYSNNWIPVDTKVKSLDFIIDGENYGLGSLMYTVCKYEEISKDPSDIVHNSDNNCLDN